MTSMNIALSPIKFVRSTSVLFGLVLTFGLAVLAHEGHDKAPGETDTATGGTITISAEARKNLGLSSVETEIRKIENTLLVLGQIQAIPDRMVLISSRIAGRVIRLPVNEGQFVKKGEVVAEVESLQVGNPPPRAEYASTIDGIVLTRDVLVGSSTDPNTKLLSVADLTEVYAQARVFEGQINQVKSGQRVRVRTEAIPDEVFEGTIERIAGSLDAETHTIRVWVRIANPGLKLRPNFQAVITIVTSEGDSVAAVPRSAVLGEVGNLFVFVEQDTNPLMFERRSVVTGISDDRYIEIIEGVLPGEKTVVAGNYQLQYVAPTRPPAVPDHDDSRPAVAVAPRAGGIVRWGLVAALVGSVVFNLVLLLARRSPGAKDVRTTPGGTPGRAR